MRSSEKSISQEIEDPLFFTHFGLYQTWVAFVLFLCTVLFYWGVKEPNGFMTRNEAYCADPTNITNFCSNACKEVRFTGLTVDSNLVTQFRWECHMKNVNLLLRVLDFCTIVAGTVFWINVRKRGSLTIICIAINVSIVNNLVFLVFPTVEVFWINALVDRFCNMAVYVLMQVLFVEIISFERLYLLLLVKASGVAAGYSLYPVVGAFIRHWLWARLGKLILSLIVWVAVQFVLDSPRQCFMRGNVEKAIRIVETILKVNRQPSEHVRKHIEITWRSYRSKPKTFESLTDMFIYPSMLLEYLRYACLTICAAMGNRIVVNDLFMNFLKGHNIIRVAYIPVHLIVGLCVWVLLIFTVSSRRISVLSFYMAALFSFFRLLNELYTVQRTLLLVANVMSQILASELEFFMLQYTPNTRRISFIFINLLLFNFGIMLGEILLNIKISWIPIAFTCIVYAFCTFTAAALVDRKYLRYCVTIRDVEVNMSRLNHR